MRSLLVLCLSAMLAASRPALAQDDTQARPKPRFHGFAFKVHGVKTSPWTWTCFGGTCQARQAGGLGLNVSYAPVPTLAAYVAADLLVEASSEYLTGWTTYEAGVPMRLPLHPPLLPDALAGPVHPLADKSPRAKFSP